MNKHDRLSVCELNRLAAIAHSKTATAERLVALSQMLESASREKIAKSDQGQHPIGPMAASLPNGEHVDRAMLLDHLEKAKRHVAKGADHVVHQKEILAELFRRNGTVGFVLATKRRTKPTRSKNNAESLPDGAHEQRFPAGFPMSRDGR
jgi:hypothetical protein